MSSDKAFGKLEALAKPPTWQTTIQRLLFGDRENLGDTSCFINNTAVIKTLTNQDIPASLFASAVTGGKPLGVKGGQNGVHTKAVMDALKRPVIIQFNLKFEKSGTAGGGDHYFSAFPLDGGVVVSMGWQSIYAFPQWFRENAQGRYKKDLFQTLMREIEDGDPNAIAKLCAFLGATADGKSIPERIHGEVAGTKPRFENTHVWDLPG
jgi:hypothetical protein